MRAWSREEEGWLNEVIVADRRLTWEPASRIDETVALTPEDRRAREHAFWKAVLKEPEDGTIEL